MKKLLAVIGQIGIVIGVSSIILLSSLGLAGFPFFQKEKTVQNNSDLVRVLVNNKGKYALVPRDQYLKEFQNK